MIDLQAAREALANSRQCTAGPDDSHDGPCIKDGPPGRVEGVHLEAALAAYDAEKARADGLEKQLAARDNECRRIYYLPHTQQDRACRLPKGHAPEVGGCDEVADD